MILWSSNFLLDESTVDKLVTELKTSGCYSSKFNHYSSYYIDIDTRPENILIGMYGEIIKKVTSDLGLYHRSQYKYPYWMQVYEPNKSSCHNCHDHFNGNTFLSWVHFIKATDKKCFCFVDSDDKKTFPDTQKTGDFIVFPSWAQHEVLSNDADENRAIIAGNIEFSFLSSDHELDNQRKMSYSYAVPSTHPGTTITWETYEIERNSSNV